jgi:VWFA-related protein
VPLGNEAGGKRSRGIAAQERSLTISFLNQFRGVVEQLAAGKDRRTIVLLSDGFPMVPGREAYGLLAAYFPEIMGVGLRTIDRMQEGFEPIVRAAVKSNVPIYTIDSRGLYMPPFFDASISGPVSRMVSAVSGVMNQVATESGGTLAEFSAATGGLFFQNSNDLFRGIQRAIADGRDYYMLAYVPKNGAAGGKFRKIVVEVRDKKAAVQAKRGYWATAN